MSVGPLALPYYSLLPSDNLSELHDTYETQLEFMHSDVASGGLWTPKDCKPLHKVAIIIPFKNRTSHLVTLLSVLIPVLKRQEIMFQFFVVEQVIIQCSLNKTDIRYMITITIE